MRPQASLTRSWFSASIVCQAAVLTGLEETRVSGGEHCVVGVEFCCVFSCVQREGGREE